MKQFTATIIDPIGLYARAASTTVAIASKFHSDIKIRSSNKIGNLKSIMNVMALGIKKGDSITIIVEGSDENKAIKQIAKTMKTNNLI